MITTTDHKQMLLAGKWVHRQEKIEVYDPQDQSLIATVPNATKEDVMKAITQAKLGSSVAANMSVYKRRTILQKAAQYVREEQERFANIIAREGSKTITEARKEVRRCVETISISAEEARRMEGETISFDQVEGHENRVGYYYRFPIGIIVAITPFNDPLNLVAHKIAPAIASGNAIIVKPSSLTPLSALMLGEAFQQGGLPENVLSIVTGKGSEIGDILTTHPSVRMISFTGGLETGERIAKQAGVKKLSMELGSNSPVIVLEDANVEDAVSSCVSGAFGVAGQNCLGVQRIFIAEAIYKIFVKQFVQQTKLIKTGDKQDEATGMGPLITEKEAKRVEKWVHDAVEEGAIVLTGAERDGAFYSPTVLTNVTTEAKIATEEIFGPVVLLFSVTSLDEAIEKANAVHYGLQAGIFTNHIESAFNAIGRLEVGGVMVNESSDYRIDSMPFGGIKGSGLGREGVKFTMEEMTEPKVVSFNIRNRLS